MQTGIFTFLLSSDILLGGGALLIAGIYLFFIKPKLAELKEIKLHSSQNQSVLSEFEMCKTTIVDTLELLMKNNTLEIKGEINTYKDNLSNALEKLKKQEHTLELILDRNRKILSNTRHMSKTIDSLATDIGKLMSYLKEATSLMAEIFADLQRKNVLDSDLSARIEKLNSILNDSQRDVDTLVDMVHELIEQVGANNIDKFDIND